MKKNNFAIILIFGVLMVLSLAIFTNPVAAVICPLQNHSYVNTFSETGGTLTVNFYWSWNQNTCVVNYYSASDSASPTGTWYVSTSPSYSVVTQTYSYTATFTVTFTTHANIPPYHFLHSAVSVVIQADSSGNGATVQSNTDTITAT